jgi:hypothetical protein
VRNCDNCVIDELVHATSPKGAPDWAHTQCCFFDITIGFRRPG